jgi:hypothetical protein
MIQALLTDLDGVIRLWDGQEDAAHLSNMDQPDEFRQIVAAFLIASAFLDG